MAPAGNWRIRFNLRNKTTLFSFSLHAFKTVGLLYVSFEWFGTIETVNGLPNINMVCLVCCTVFVKVYILVFDLCNGNLSYYTYRMIYFVLKKFINVLNHLSFTTGLSYKKGINQKLVLIRVSCSIFQDLLWNILYRYYDLMILVE